MSDDLAKAKKLLQTDKVARVRQDGKMIEDFYIVTGNKDDYLVILPKFCTCTHFHINCIKEPGKVCKHILAARLSGEKTRVLDIEDWQDFLFRYR